MVSYALDVFRACSEVGEILLVVAPEDVERARVRLLQPGGSTRERVVAGGETRQASVAAALEETGSVSDLVLVHDGARPLLRPELIRRCIGGAAEHGSAIAAVPATDTVKEAGPDGLVMSTLDRTRLWLVQTPQAFHRDLLIRAHEFAARSGFRGTDEAAVVENMGHKVHLVRGDPDNIKVTWPEDVRRTEQMMGWKSEGMSDSYAMRVGIGYDAHRFAEDRPLVLAGVRIRDTRGLLGHSDADVVCHAISDALLGAIGAGDIGGHFPDTDPSYSGVSSLSLLQRVTEMVREQGWDIENVDAVVIAEEPRIAPHLPEMRQALAHAMGTDECRVSLKGKTTEGMGFTGRREGIASHAVATVRPRDTMSAGASSEE